jgi:hypothetical protein
MAGYLTTLIGKKIHVEFLLGNSQYMDKSGILRRVGANYFVMEDLISHETIVADLYSVKFVTTM